MILSACLKRLLDCEAITSSLSEFYIFLYVLFSKSRVLSSLLKLEMKFTFSIKTIFSFFFEKQSKLLGIFEERSRRLISK